MKAYSRSITKQRLLQDWDRHSQILAERVYMEMFSQADWSVYTHAGYPHESLLASFENLCNLSSEDGEQCLITGRDFWELECSIPYDLVRLASLVSCKIYNCESKGPAAVDFMRSFFSMIQEQADLSPCVNNLAGWMLQNGMYGDDSISEAPGDFCDRRDSRFDLALARVFNLWRAGCLDVRAWQECLKGSSDRLHELTRSTLDFAIAVHYQTEIRPELADAVRLMSEAIAQHSGGFQRQTFAGSQALSLAGGFARVGLETSQKKPVITRLPLEAVLTFTHVRAARWLAARVRQHFNQFQTRDTRALLAAIHGQSEKQVEEKYESWYLGRPEGCVFPLASPPADHEQRIKKMIRSGGIAVVNDFLAFEAGLKASFEALGLRLLAEVSGIL